MSEETAAVEQRDRYDIDSLPPVAYLIMETLAARYRLGEMWWTFHTKVRGAAHLLEGLGLVSVFHGNVEHTFRVELTEYGKDSVLSPTYQPPIFKES